MVAYSQTEQALAKKYKRVTGVQPIGLIDMLHILTSDDMVDEFRAFLLEDKFRKQDEENRQTWTAFYIRYGATDSDDFRSARDAARFLDDSYNDGELVPKKVVGPNGVEYPYPRGDEEDAEQWAFLLRNAQTHKSWRE